MNSTIIRHPDDKYFHIYTLQPLLYDSPDIVKSKGKRFQFTTNYYIDC